MSRTLTAALLACCLAVLAMALPGGRVAPVSAATAPKVVIIVGPAGGATASYRSDADIAAAEAAKFTPDVVTISSPTATWDAAQPALQGASIVIYMGHGNGWPSPYGPFQPYTKDGIGLNPSAGTDDTTTKYWGEYYLANQVRLAPNAVVILAHLCYSAGNSEAGQPDPTLDVAQQRVDNMAAGWIAAGAGAVVAEAYSEGLWGGAAWYVDQLFTTSQSIDQIWRTDPTQNGNVLSFPSTRSPGAIAQMDPDNPAAPPFRRAMVGRLDLQSQAVTGGWSGTGPAFSVPGGASVTTDGAGLFVDPLLTPDPSTGRPPVTLPATTFVQIDAAAAPVNGSTVYAVHTVDGRYGFMSAADLSPDGQNAGAAMVPVDPLSGVETSAPYFYPQDADGLAATTGLSFVLGGPATVSATVTDRTGSPVAVAYVATNLPAGSYDWAWDGRTGSGAFVAPGTYRFIVTATVGTVSWTQSTSVYAGAFRITSSAAKPKRGSTITITAVSAETLSARPRLSIVQPGYSARRVTMTKVGANTYRATVQLRAGGRSGVLKLTVSGLDEAGQANAASTTLTLR